MGNINTRGVLVTGAAIVAAVAMAASADTLATLGGAVGWGDTMKWSLPVAVDVLALVSGLVWLTAGLPEAARRLGCWLTLVTVVGSMVLNATGHLVSTDHIVVGPPLVIAVSAVPPLAAALAVHLAAMTAQGRHGRGTGTETGTAGAAPVPEPARGGELSVSAATGTGTGTGTDGTTDTAGTETDTVALIPDTVTAGTDTAHVPVPRPADTAAQAPEPTADTADTVALVPDTVTGTEAEETGTADTVAEYVTRPLSMPETGGRLTETELDAVVVLLVRETDPPRSYRQMEDRFRELGYSASAKRLRAAWTRVAVPAAG
ncbi:DUF2637 domain-containing protein [Streptomyces sp. SHP 1-2]|uniref:DUF2637 domain-containing protein n=1 Tax=Streptomyces sp. SHP 1-2 TaxID=2769489 RepID=UPI00223719C4|nr:DUF2637 domain-containing protein [Streptomyces sp. SHP 1-2]MCW5254719.1 DUF2637 domain-containing protein [Streptomyces sp. SHP 1-2]